MRLRVIGRQDPFLFAGLVFALIVVFQRSIFNIFDAATDVERIYGVSLRPALLILTVMFVFHQYARRREMKAEAAAAATEARLARARTEELEHLMVFGQALARALTTDAVREAVVRHLPLLAAGADAWVAVKSDSGWERLIDSGCTQWPAGAIESIAEQVAKDPDGHVDRREGIEQQGHACFPMIVGDTVAGVIGLPVCTHNQAIRQTIGAAATLLAISIRNAQLFANLRDHSVKDALTGCYNRAHGIEVLGVELARSRRGGNPVSSCSSTSITSSGSTIGTGTSAAMVSSPPSASGCSRCCAEPTCGAATAATSSSIVLPETGESGAARVAEWIRLEMEQVLTAASGEHVGMTVSVGTATTHHGDVLPAEIIDRADRALYEAKAQGRNCVRGGLHSSIPTTAAVSLAAS